MSVTKQTALAAIIRLERERMALRATALSDRPPIDARDQLRKLDAKIARAWHYRRKEMTGCTDETPDSFNADRRGLISVTIKTDPAMLESRRTNAARVKARQRGAVLVEAGDD